MRHRSRRAISAGFGVPSISISVALTSVGCTTNSCVAIGASTIDDSPMSVGELRGVSGAGKALQRHRHQRGQLSRFIGWADTCMFVGQDALGTSYGDLKRRRVWCRT